VDTDGRLSGSPGDHDVSPHTRAEFINEVLERSSQGQDGGRGAIGIFEQGIRQALQSPALELFLDFRHRYLSPKKDRLHRLLSLNKPLLELLFQVYNNPSNYASNLEQSDPTAAVPDVRLMIDDLDRVQMIHEMEGADVQAFLSDGKKVLAMKQADVNECPNTIRKVLDRKFGGAVDLKIVLALCQPPKSQQFTALGGCSPSMYGRPSSAPSTAREQAAPADQAIDTPAIEDADIVS